MRLKTFLIIALSVLATVILMKNTDEINFWIFGEVRVPKLAMMGAMLVCGFIIGYLAGRPRKKIVHPEEEQEDTLSAEDREFIS